jgi:hypothetical protein
MVAATALSKRRAHPRRLPFGGDAPRDGLARWSLHVRNLQPHLW